LKSYWQLKFTNPRQIESRVNTLHAAF
jgi:hypothetical protein